MQNKTLFLKTAGPLLLVLFIDGMGLGLVIPVLNGLIFEPTGQSFLARMDLTPMMRNMLYGSMIGIFMLCWFFGAAFLGDLSDRIGRKKSLIICLTGAFLSYLLSAFSVSLESITLLVLGRIIAGLTSGSQPIAQAAIIDLSQYDEKSRNIGFILLSLSLGFILGPLFGGILADSRIVPWFSFATPFYFAAAISLLNIILLWRLFNETSVVTKPTLKINPYHALDLFITAFKHEKIRGLSIVYFIYIFGWSSYYSFIAMYLLKTYNFNATDISLFMAVMGIGFGIGNGYLGNYLAKRITLKESYIYSVLISMVSILLMIYIRPVIFSWIMVVPLACSVSIAYAAVLTLFSNQVDSSSQGWVMGISGSIMAFVFAINGIIVGTLATWSAVLPLYIAAICLGVSAMTTLVFFKTIK